MSNSRIYLLNAYLLMKIKVKTLNYQQKEYGRKKLN